MFFKVTTDYGAYLGAQQGISLRLGPISNDIERPISFDIGYLRKGYGMVILGIIGQKLRLVGYHVYSH